jgi:predicted small secreted protein
VKKLITLFSIIFGGLASYILLYNVFKEENLWMQMGFVAAAIVSSCNTTAGVHELINLLGKKAKK